MLFFLGGEGWRFSREPVEVFYLDFFWGGVPKGTGRNFTRFGWVFSQRKTRLLGMCQDQGANSFKFQVFLCGAFGFTMCAQVRSLTVNLMHLSLYWPPFRVSEVWPKSVSLSTCLREHHAMNRLWHFSWNAVFCEQSICSQAFLLPACDFSCGRS